MLALVDNISKGDISQVEFCKIDGAGDKGLVLEDCILGTLHCCPDF